MGESEKMEKHVPCRDTKFVISSHYIEYGPTSDREEIQGRESDRYCSALGDSYSERKWTSKMTLSQSIR